MPRKGLQPSARLLPVISTLLHIHIHNNFAVVKHNVTGNVLLVILGSIRCLPQTRPLRNPLPLRHR